MTKVLESEMEGMCNLSDGVEARGIEKGREESILASILNLMETMGWSAQEAMTALKIPADEQALYAGKIERKEIGI